MGNFYLEIKDSYSLMESAGPGTILNFDIHLMKSVKT